MDVEVAARRAESADGSGDGVGLKLRRQQPQAEPRRLEQQLVGERPVALEQRRQCRGGSLARRSLACPSANPSRHPRRGARGEEQVAFQQLARQARGEQQAGQSAANCTRPASLDSVGSCAQQHQRASPRRPAGPARSGPASRSTGRASAAAPTASAASSAAAADAGRWPLPTPASPAASTIERPAQQSGRIRRTTSVSCGDGLATVATRTLSHVAATPSSAAVSTNRTPTRSEAPALALREHIDHRRAEHARSRPSRRRSSRANRSNARRSPS